MYPRKRPTPSIPENSDRNRKLLAEKTERESDIMVVRNLITGLKERKAWLIKYFLPAYNQYKKGKRAQDNTDLEAANRMRQVILEHTGSFTPTFERFNNHLQEKFSKALAEKKATLTLEQFANHFTNLLDPDFKFIVPPYQVMSELDIIWEALNNLEHQLLYPGDHIQTRTNPKKGPPAPSKDLPLFE